GTGLAARAKNADVVELLRRILPTSRNLYGVLVSLDEKAALITATFIEGRLDYRHLFDDGTGSVIGPYEDDNTRIYVAGQPWLYGWVYHYAKEVFLIFLATAVLLW